MAPPRQDRRTALIDAAIEVIDTTGLRGLTHRATEARAGLAPGTCSYHFPTRRALITAILLRIAEAERADIQRASQGRLSTHMDPATLLDGATETVAHWLGPARARTRAAMLLALDSGSRELDVDTVYTVAAEFRGLASQVTGDDERAQFVADLVNGLIVGELTSDRTTVDVERLRERMAAIVSIALGREAR